MGTILNLIESLFILIGIIVYLYVLVYTVVTAYYKARPTTNTRNWNITVTSLEEAKKIIKELEDKS